MTEFWLRYVPHERVPAYEALGWFVIGARGERMGGHGFWSCLMKWMGDGEPREPVPNCSPQAVAVEGKQP